MILRIRHWTTHDQLPDPLAAGAGRGADRVGHLGRLDREASGHLARSQGAVPPLVA